MLNLLGLNRTIDLLNSDLSMIAIGTGTAPDSTGTQLTSELLRKAPSDTFIDGYTIIKELYLDENEATGTLTELGIFCNGATSTPGTGELFASDAANITKDNTQSLTISFEIEVKEVNY